MQPQHEKLRRQSVANPKIIGAIYRVCFPCGVQRSDVTCRKNLEVPILPSLCRRIQSETPTCEVCTPSASAIQHTTITDFSVINLAERIRTIPQKLQLGVHSLAVTTRQGADVASKHILLRRLHRHRSRYLFRRNWRACGSRLLTLRSRSRAVASGQSNGCKTHHHQFTEHRHNLFPSLKTTVGIFTKRDSGSDRAQPSRRFQGWRPRYFRVQLAYH